MKHRSRVYLICGSGGVGKTTISAALGLKFAQKGFKTIVLTIDPAKRLATSLGISGLTDQPKRIDIENVPENGEMWAMMLDTKRTFDLIVEKYAPDAEAARTILGNRVYQHMSGMLAGTQEYMAMEKMYEVYQQNDWDVIILDTPPMQNALEFLAAPRRMMNLIDDSMLQILLKPALFIGKSGLRILERGSRQIIRVLDRIAGFAFIQELSEMFVLFKDLLGGFEVRAGKVNQLLGDPACGFITVCTTSDNSVSETRRFKEQLDGFHYHLDKIIVNRIYKDNRYANDDMASYQDRLKEYVSEEEAGLLLENYVRFVPLIRGDRKILNRLFLLIGKSNILTVPLFLSDVHDLVGLQRVADELDML